VENEEATIARQRRCNHVSVARNQHTTKEESLQVVFSVCGLRRDYIASENGKGLLGSTSTVALGIVGGDRNGTQCLGV
jgi:hypothetical protein